MSSLPEKIGDYEVLRELGRGAMGVVYLARHPALGREMAVKVMAPELARDPDFMERFRREGEAAARLRHPNIVGVFDFATRDGLSFIAMEFLGAETLKDLLQDKGQQTFERAGEIIDELLSALHAAHNKGIVHRDIKPANIMLTDEGSVALTDFSIAHMKEASKLTQTGAIVGTPEYMAPEQFDGVWDPRTDLYATGIIFYELLTGFSPFRSQTITEVMRKQLLTVPDPPHIVDFTIPEALSLVVTKALEKDPENRYQDAQEMRQAIKAALTAVEAPAAPPSASQALVTAPAAPPSAPHALVTAPAAPPSAPQALVEAPAAPPSAPEALVTASAPPEPASLVAPAASVTTPMEAASPTNTLVDEATVLGAPHKELFVPRNAPPPGNPGSCLRNVALLVAALVGILLVLAGLGMSDAAKKGAAALPPSQPQADSRAKELDPVSLPTDSWQPKLAQEPVEPEPSEPESSEMVLGVFPESGVILPSLCVGDVVLSMSQKDVRQIWGEPSEQNSSDGYAHWLYSNANGNCVLTFDEDDGQLALIAIAHPDYLVQGNRGAAVGQQFETVLGQFPNPSSQQPDHLDYREQGLAFRFQDGVCSYVIVYLARTEPPPI